MSYVVTANSGAARIATLAIANHLVTISQDGTGPACTYALSGDTARTFSATGGTGTIAVTVIQGTNCTWSANSGASFVNITSGANVAGNGTVSFSVGVNTGPARTGTLTIASQTASVNQNAVGTTFRLPSPYEAEPGALRFQQ